MVGKGKIAVLFFVFFVLLIGACTEAETNDITDAPVATQDTLPEDDFKLWVWMHGKPLWSDDSLRIEFARLRSFGIDAVLTGGDTAYLNRVVPIAAQSNIEIHAWTWIMNQPGNEECKQHPEWYAVSREGNSSLDKRPYVDYYQWLCPSKLEVQQYLKSRVAELAQVDGLASVHLDYIRYPDVILPVGLWEKYGLEMHTEHPEFDFCYCDDCQQAFYAQSGRRVEEMDDPTADSAWRAYRYQSIVDMVAALSDTIHHHQKQTTAAVFPYPELARKLVRQSWAEWDLDAALPMIYHNFYLEDVPWVGTATEAGVTEVAGRFPIHTGLYLPSLSGEELEAAINEAKEHGAKGVALFDVHALSEEQTEVLTRVFGSED